MTDQLEAAPGARRGIPARWLLAFIAGWLALDQLLLWQFLGLPAAALPLGLAAAALLVWRIATAGGLSVRVPLARLALCLGFVLILLVLSGEGRFFYANIDWQVREAVLRDMAINPWPFVYVTGSAEPFLLRAPIGMFLVPALAFKAWGQTGGDLMLLGQNTLLIGTLLALGSLLFDTVKARAIALVTVTLFSGLDLVGMLLFRGKLNDHYEFWFENMQFSSHITQIFWVPQHGFAGWLGALLFLLWQQKHMPLWPFFALLPLTALWSPLALIGVLPFAAWAGLVTLRQRGVTIADIGWPLLSVLLVTPGLLYLAAAGDGVGIRPYPVTFVEWAIFIGLEILLFVVIIGLRHRDSRFGSAPLWIATLWLLVCPFIQIGWSLDFMMRTSIPGLAVLAVLVADAIYAAPARWVRTALKLLIILGSVTGFSEIRRAFLLGPVPPPRCSFFAAWDANFKPYPKGSYLAPISKVPALIRPADPARMIVNDPHHCWQGDWTRPEGV